MPIPPCDDRGDVCCESWFALADTIAGLAADAIEICVGEQCPEIGVYVCHGEPIGGGDYVAVWLSAVSPRIGQGKIFFSPVIRLTYTVAVCLEGYPMPRIDGGEITAIPSPLEHSNAAYFTYGAAEAAYRAVLASVNGNGAGPKIGGCDLVAFGDLLPEQPAMYSARWMFTVIVDNATDRAPMFAS